jgi:hypothetical protein
VERELDAEARPRPPAHRPPYGLQVQPKQPYPSGEPFDYPQVERRGAATRSNNARQDK